MGYTEPNSLLELWLRAGHLDVETAKLVVRNRVFRLT
jgi:hypothetical protein